MQSLLKSNLKLFVAFGGIALVSACAKKEQPLPPPPAPATAPAQQAPSSPVETGRVTPSVLPGSVQDFVNAAGADRVFFEYDSYALSEAARSTLQKQAQWLKQYPAVKVTVEGHCDERGTREYNLALGDRRANAVRSYLIAQGVEANRLTAISYGKERPEVLSSDEASYAKNRRGVSTLVGATG